MLFLLDYRKTCPKSEPWPKVDVLPYKKISVDEKFWIVIYIYGKIFGAIQNLNLEHSYQKLSRKISIYEKIIQTWKIGINILSWKIGVKNFHDKSGNFVRNFLVRIGFQKLVSV